MEQIINSIGHMSPSLVDHAEPLLSGTGYFLEFLYDFSHLMFLIVFFLLLFESEIEYRYFMIDTNYVYSYLVNVELNVKINNLLVKNKVKR